MDTELDKRCANSLQFTIGFQKVVEATAHGIEVQPPHNQLSEYLGNYTINFLNDYGTEVS